MPAGPNAPTVYTVCPCVCVCVHVGTQLWRKKNSPSTQSQVIKDHLKPFVHLSFLLSAAIFSDGWWQYRYSMLPHAVKKHVLVLNFLYVAPLSNRRLLKMQGLWKCNSLQQVCLKDWAGVIVFLIVEQIPWKDQSQYNTIHSDFPTLSVEN